MTENDNERSKRVIDNFNSILPRLWDRGREENAKLESEFLPESLDGESIEVLGTQAFGKEAWEERKAMRAERRLKADYGEWELNIVECPRCAHDEVLNSDIDWEIISGNKSIKSMKVRGAVCLNCSETFVASNELNAIRKVSELLNELFPEDHE